MLQRFGLAVGFSITALTLGCDPCSQLACLLCLSAAGGGGGQASLQPGAAELSSQANAVTEHVVAQAKPGAQSF